MVRAHLECCVQFFTSEKEECSRTKNVQRGPTKMIRSMERLLYQERLEGVGLLQFGMKKADQGPDKGL